MKRSFYKIRESCSLNLVLGDELHVGLALMPAGLREGGRQREKELERGREGERETTSERDREIDKDSACRSPRRICLRGEGFRVWGAGVGIEGLGFRV
jgi:hypothetical protein